MVEELYHGVERWGNERCAKSHTVKRKERIRTYPPQRQKPVFIRWVLLIYVLEEMDSRKVGNNRKISASPCRLLKREEGKNPWNIYFISAISNLFLTLILFFLFCIPRVLLPHFNYRCSEEHNFYLIFFNDVNDD